MGAAYMGIRWTQWGTRHLAAIDCYSGGSPTSSPRISFHIGNRTLAWSFDEDNITRWDGGNVWGTWNFDPGSKAAANSVCQWDTALTEFGAVPTGESSGTADLPAPYVLVGLRNTFYLHYLRAVKLRNQ